MWQQLHPHANIGLLCGSSSKVCVIDIDPRNGGEESLVRLARAGKRFTDTVESETPSGGRHKFYAYDPKVAVSGSNKLGSGIDISSNGHHVVLAPSYWPKADKFYRWVVPPLGTELPQLPKWVVEMLAPKPKRQPLKRINYGNMQGYRRQALADLEYQMRKIAGLTDDRHEAPFKAGAALGA